MDRAWWNQYYSRAQVNFKGELVTCSNRVTGVKSVKFEHGENSGAGAMALAEYFGARQIILLGYDCKYALDGKRHWHGDHPKALGNAISMPKWKSQFKNIAGHLGNCEIVNASRETALDFWPVISLEDALCKFTA